MIARTILLAAAGGAALACAAPAPAADKAIAGRAGAAVYILPVKGQIERGLLYVFRRGIAEAERSGASVIVLDMDTPGGRLDVARDIVQILLRLPAGIETYTFVNGDAISAGAIIAMATRHIYMAPGSRIGDCMPLLASPFGTPQAVPGELREKALSPTEALMRAAAEHNGHDPLLAEAMVRPETVYRIGDEVISPSNRVLTLTNVEAEREVGEGAGRRKLLSAGTVNSLDELLRRVGRAEAPRRHLAVTAAEQLARYIESFPISGILLALGLLGIYVEIKTPGFGLPGIAGITLLSIWFWGHHIAGLAGLGEVVLFLVGLGLLAVEVFVLPGFGFMGVAGIALMSVSLIMAMVQHYPGGAPWAPQQGMQAVGQAFVTLSFSLALTLAAGLFLARYLPQARLFRNVVLSAQNRTESGYRASQDLAVLLAARGVTTTPLRPAGTARFGDRLVSVVTRGDFVEGGAGVVVTEVEGNRVVVERAGEGV